MHGDSVRWGAAEKRDFSKVGFQKVGLQEVGLQEVGILFRGISNCKFK
jgi:hypothetical protein